MENDEIQSQRNIQVGSLHHIHSVCKIIDHAQHTKFKYIDLNLLQSEVLERNSQYSYLLGILRRHKEQGGRKNQTVIEMKVMVELSEMLQTCKLLSPMVLDSFLAKVMDWFSNRQTNSNQIVTKLLEINSQRSKSTGRKVTEDGMKKSIDKDSLPFNRPKTGILRGGEISSMKRENRPNSAVFGNLNYHKYRPFSGAPTNASTGITKNMSINDQTAEINQRSDLGEQSEEDEQERDNNDIQEIQIDCKKLYARDSNKADHQNTEPYPKRRGDFQHTKQGDLVLHQVLGNENTAKENRTYRNKMEAQEIKQIVDAYQKNKVRGTAQSYRRIESAKVFRNIKPSITESKPDKESMWWDEKQNDASTDVIFNLNAPENPTKQRFTTQRPVSAIIKPWTKQVTHHIQPTPKSKLEVKGYSLTRPVSAVPQRILFEPLDQKYIRETNIVAYDQIQKIKMLLGKGTDIPTKDLSKALVYDEWEMKQNFVKPDTQLLNNPFMKKKKKKVLRKKKKVLD